MKEIWKYICSDYQRYTNAFGDGKTVSCMKIIMTALIARNHCFAYSFWLRLASKKNLFCFIAKIMHYRLSRKYGIQIPRITRIGYGFYIGHGVGIIINGRTIIGNNCNVSQFLSIGTTKNTPAIIGDNVYIGPNVCIVEDVCIGNNSVIGAGAVVVKDVPDGATVVGVPAKVIGYKDNTSFIHNQYRL